MSRGEGGGKGRHTQEEVDYKLLQPSYKRREPLVGGRRGDFSNLAEDGS